MAQITVKELGEVRSRLARLPGQGYSAREVDEFLDAVVARLDVGGDPRGLAAEASFPLTRGAGEGYRTEEVDALVSRLREGDTGAATVPGTRVTLPSLAPSMVEATIGRWHAQIGDIVTAGESLVELSTDRFDTELPSPVTGTVVELPLPQGATARVGQVLAVIQESPVRPALTDSSVDEAPAWSAAVRMQPLPEEPGFFARLFGRR